MPGSRRQRVGCLLTAAVVLLLAGCGPGSTREEPGTVPRSFVGLQAPDIMLGDASTIASGMAEAAATGAGFVRQPVYWNEAEPEPGVYDWTRLDAVMAAAARHRLDV